MNNYILASHNSWTFLPPKTWWQKLLKFTARCQSLDIIGQYVTGATCFDLRIRWNAQGELVFAHGIIEYDYTAKQLAFTLDILNDIAKEEKIYIRVIHECRTAKQIETSSRQNFHNFCLHLEDTYPNIRFFGGTNLYDAHRDFHFLCPDLTIDGKYSSVQPPRFLDDWFPWLYAKLNNHKNLQTGTDQQVLMIDFVNIK